METPSSRCYFAAIHSAQAFLQPAKETSVQGPFKLLLVSVSLSFFCGFAVADDKTSPPPAKPGRVVNTLMTQPFVELPGRVTQILSVEYGPGFEATSHTHPGPLYGYVLEGSYVTEIDSQPMTTYTKGQVFFEPAGGVHRISRNPSSTEPLKLLIFIVAEEGKPVASPVK
jgi:quercetin dioxygenase-like cupin family protein